MNTQELKEQIDALYETFCTEHAKTTKEAHIKARKALSDLKQTITIYRKTSVEEDSTL